MAEAEKPSSTATQQSEEKAPAPRFSEVVRQRLAAGIFPVVTAYFPTVAIHKRRGRPPELSEENETAARAELKRYLDEEHPEARRDPAIFYIQNWLLTTKQVTMGTSTIRDRIVAPIFHERKNTTTQP